MLVKLDIVLVTIKVLTVNVLPIYALLVTVNATLVPVITKEVKVPTPAKIFGILPFK